MDRKGAPNPVEARIAEIAGSQYTIVSHEQLRATGLSAERIRGRLERGRLRTIYRGVYSASPAPLGAHGLWLAAVRACDPNAVLSHRSAAALWGIRPHASRQVDVSVAGRNGRKPRRGITLHRPTRLSAADVAVHERIPVTTVPRTMLDLAAMLPRRPLERAIDEAERLRLLDGRALHETLERNQGRHRAAALAALLQSHVMGTTPTRNDLEELFLKLCDDHGIPRPLVNTEIGAYSPDFLWPEHKLIVETDGRASHGTRAAFEHDRACDAWLTANGYRVVRFTYRQVLNEPAKVTGLILRLLR